MKIILIILLGTVAFAKPLEQNELTKANKEKLFKLIGSSASKLKQTEFPGATRKTYPNKIVDTYLFVNNESCTSTYYFDNSEIITDVKMSSNACFGPHKFRSRSLKDRTLAGQN